MTKLKIAVLFLLLLSTAFSLVGCSDDATSQAGPLPLVFQGQAYTFNSETGTILHGAQQIGVFLIDADKNTILNDYCNLKYYADNRNTTGYFIPDGKPIYLKAGERVNAVSYYPYLGTNDLSIYSQYVYPIDISNQKTAKPDAFLYDNATKNIDNGTGKVKLELRPVLSRIKLTFVRGTNISESRLQKMKVSLKGVPAKAQFDLLRGEFLTLPLTRDKQRATNDEIAVDIHADLTASIVIYSSVLAENATLHIKLSAEAGKDETEMSWSLNNVIPNIESNTQYFVLMRITEEGIKAELTGQSPIYILDWNKDADVDGNAPPLPSLKNTTVM